MRHATCWFANPIRWLAQRMFKTARGFNSASGRASMLVERPLLSFVLENFIRAHDRQICAISVTLNASGFSFTLRTKAPSLPNKLLSTLYYDFLGDYNHNCVPFIAPGGSLLFVATTCAKPLCGSCGLIGMDGCMKLCPDQCFIVYPIIQLMVGGQACIIMPPTCLVLCRIYQIW